MFTRKRGSAAAAVGLLEQLRGHALTGSAHTHGRHKSRNALMTALRTLALISVARQIGFRRAGRMLMLLAASGSFGEQLARRRHHR